MGAALFLTLIRLRYGAKMSVAELSLNRVLSYIIRSELDLERAGNGLFETGNGFFESNDRIVA